MGIRSHVSFLSWKIMINPLCCCWHGHFCWQPSWSERLFRFILAVSLHLWWQWQVTVEVWVLAEEWKQCTNLAIHTFTNQLWLQGIFFKFSLLSNLEMNSADAPNFLGCDFWRKHDKSVVNSWECKIRFEFVRLGKSVLGVKGITKSFIWQYRRWSPLSNHKPARGRFAIKCPAPLVGGRGTRWTWRSTVWKQRGFISKQLGCINSRTGKWEWSWNSDAQQSTTRCSSSSGIWGSQRWNIHPVIQY